MIRRSPVAFFCFIFLSALTAASRLCAGSAPAASAAQNWEPLIEAARKDGVVSIYGRPDAQAQQALAQFEKAYQGIRVNTLPVPGNVMISRLAAEYRAKKHLVDIVVSTTPYVLKPMDLYAPLKSAVVLPEALDPSAWWEKKLWWFDDSEPYVMLNFQGIAQAHLTYNTHLVDPKSLTSWADLLNPRWKGKIVSTDPRRGSNSVDAMQFIYYHPKLGPRYLERFFNEMDVAVTANYRQMGDWLGQGRFHLAFGLGSLAASQAAAQGLPVASLMTQRFKEGAPMTSSGGGIAWMRHAPHPNAAKLFLNWFLSREGQTAWQRLTKHHSLRIDISKDGLRPETTPIPGRNYVFTSTEEHRRAREPVEAFLRKILDQGGK